MTIPTTPVHIGTEAGGVYTNAVDAGRWAHAIQFALDPYKAPEVRAAADSSLIVLRRLLVDGASGTNAIPPGDLSDLADKEIISKAGDK